MSVAHATDAAAVGPRLTLLELPSECLSMIAKLLSCSLCTQRLRETCKKARQAIPSPPSIFNVLHSNLPVHELHLLDFGKLSLLRRGRVQRQPSVMFLASHKDLPWDFSLLSGHSEVASLIELFAGAPWDWNRISSRRDLTISFVRQHLPHLRYFFASLSRNTSFTEDALESAMDLPWSFQDFAQNKNLSLAFYVKHQDRFTNWGSIAHLSAEDMLSLPDKPWKWSQAWSIGTVEQRACILLEQSQQKAAFDWTLSVRPMRIGLMFRTEPDASAVFAKLSYSADLTIEFLRAHPSAAWDWAAVSRNTAIPLQDKLANPRMPWVDVYNRYRDGPAPPLVEVMRHRQIDWNYEDLADSVPVAELLASAEVLPWVLDNFSMVQWRATLNEVLQYPSLPWDWSALSEDLPWVALYRTDVPWDYTAASSRDGDGPPAALLRHTATRPWIWQQILRTADFGGDFDCAFLQSVPADALSGLLLNDTITWQHICTNPSIPWPLELRFQFDEYVMTAEDRSIAVNPDCWAYCHPVHLVGDCEWMDFDQLSYSGDISISIILRLKDYSWNWEILTKNALGVSEACLQPSHVFEHLHDLPWKLEHLVSYFGARCSNHFCA